MAADGPKLEERLRKQGRRLGFTIRCCISLCYNLSWTFVELKNSYGQEQFLMGVPSAEAFTIAFTKKLVSPLLLSSITRKKLVRRHMDFHLDLNFRKLADSAERHWLFLGPASVS